MSIDSPNFSNTPPQESHEEIPLGRRSERFGDIGYVEHALKDFDVVDQGEISEVFPVDPHMNEVRILRVGDQNTVNEAHFVTLKGEGKELYGVFKPYSGESLEAREQLGYDHLFAKEVLSYRVSELFGMDLVPPTVLRTVNGDLGSLQLFMPNEEYETVQRLSRQCDADWRDMLLNNSDFGKLALFDYITAQSDRHMNNIMVRGVKEFKETGLPHDNHELIAIDNGFSLNQKAYEMCERVSGPHITLSTSPDLEGNEREFMTGRGVSDPTLISIPDDEIQMLKEGYKKISELPMADLIEYVSPQERKQLEMRIEELIQTKVYLSRYNYRTAFHY